MDDMMLGCPWGQSQVRVEFWPPKFGCQVLLQKTRDEVLGEHIPYLGEHRSLSVRDPGPPENQTSPSRWKALGKQCGFMNAEEKVEGPH